MVCSHHNVCHKLQNILKTLKSQSNIECGGFQQTAFTLSVVNPYRSYKDYLNLMIVLFTHYNFSHP